MQSLHRFIPLNPLSANVDHVPRLFRTDLITDILYHRQTRSAPKSPTSSTVSRNIPAAWDTHQNILPILRGQILVRRLGCSGNRRLAYIHNTKVDKPLALRRNSGIRSSMRPTAETPKQNKKHRRLTDGIIKSILLRTKHCHGISPQQSRTKLSRDVCSRSSIVIGRSVRHRL
jgi:uncharacterized protein YwbE